VLGLGKVSKEIFDRSVRPFLPIEKLELDGTIIDLKRNTVIAHSPSIGVPLEALGFFAFHYSASNVASKFGKPKYMITGLYLPLKTKEKDLKIISENLGREARKYGVKIIAGQTATYSGLEIPLITSTCLGEQVREPIKPEIGDRVLIIGEVGYEGIWLDELSRGVKDRDWKQYTPLPIALKLQSCQEVKVMHDVSEGGVKGALLEIVESLNVGIEVDSTGIKFAKSLEEKKGDPLRSPSYGTLITITSKDGVKKVREICKSIGYSLSNIGRISKEKILLVDKEQVIEQKRVLLDEIYGSFRPKDEVLNELEKAAYELVNIEGLASLIPQVGTNIVYAKKNAKDIEDVAGISGRIVRTVDGPLICGEISYGGSYNLSKVIIEAIKLDKHKRSAINLKFNERITQKLQSIGLDTVTIPMELKKGECPVVLYINKSQEIHDVYIHPGSLGIEPTTTIISDNPSLLVTLMTRLAKFE
jgi:predicted fused transcriptional regulator/phosphomethylpyrimidine kinase/hydrogenase maturation factor